MARHSRNDRWANCDHPRTAENTYYEKRIVGGKIVPRERCRICALGRAARSHAAEKAAGQKRAHVATRPKKRAVFCPSCLRGECGRLHTRPDARCLKPVSDSVEAHVCACGAAWAPSWKAEMKKLTIVTSGALAGQGLR